MDAFNPLEESECFEQEEPLLTMAEFEALMRWDVAADDEEV